MCLHYAWTRTRAYPHAMAVMGRAWGTCGSLIALTWVLIRDKVNAWREGPLELKRTTLAELELSKVPFLYNSSPSVAPKPNDWGHMIHVKRYWFAKQDKQKAKLAKELPERITKAKAEGKKIVYIGFGSIIVLDPQRMTDAVIGAVDESKVFAITSGGWTPGAAAGVAKGATEGAAEVVTDVSGKEAGYLPRGKWSTGQRKTRAGAETGQKLA
ncbi:hypothetical protein PSTG_04232 [Puccinia striiformis f. sp. tritici PST-78]|uniref:Glycosyltransferase family 28 N-terminal domain-containing protein n=1 Tax=Puccinia striiformis f. sp. tritici PST-78 TaxID=1165861 RepID=A0A0L0VUH4_9BASI|nr:hypothetical protein PSTG_04232 [Puccinia striiformis f. sp. tritici PST-78]